VRPLRDPEEPVRPLVLGYLRVRAADPPEVGGALTAEIRAYTDREGLALAEVYTDLFDPPTGGGQRAGFCALMDALRRHTTHAVIILAPEHLSRGPNSYTERRTIIEIEAGARLLVIHSPVVSGGG
jgi:hypothetical protein